MRKIEKQNVVEWIDALRSVSGKNAETSKRLLQLASRPSRQRVVVNLEKLEKFAKGKDNIVVPGKVLASGSVTKAFAICAIEYSQDATDKLKKAGCEIIDIKKMLGRESLRIIM